MRICKNCNNSYEIDLTKTDILCPHCGYKQTLEETAQMNKYETISKIQPTKKLSILAIAIYYLGIQTIIPKLFNFIIVYVIYLENISIFQNFDFETYYKILYQTYSWSFFVLNLISFLILFKVFKEYLQVDFYKIKTDFKKIIIWIILSLLISLPSIILISLFIYAMNGSEILYINYYEYFQTACLTSKYSGFTTILMILTWVLIIPFSQEIIYTKCVFNLFIYKPTSKILLASLIKVLLTILPGFLLITINYYSERTTIIDYYVHFCALLYYIPIHILSSIIYNKTGENVLSTIIFNMIANLLFIVLIILM